MTNVIWDEKRYFEYLEDIDIARKAIKEEFLYPDDKEILFDIYAIPSHNHQAYYAVLYKTKNGYEMVYARTEIYTLLFSEPIRMYPFTDAIAAKKHPASDGRIIIGTKKVNEDLISLLNEITTKIPEKKMIHNHLIVIDGVFQAIRSFNHSSVEKTIVYRDADKILLSHDKASLINAMNDLYLTIIRPMDIIPFSVLMVLRETS